MKSIFFGSFIALLLFFVESPVSASIVDDSKAIEHVGFRLEGLKICHQLEWRNMSIDFEYDSKLGEKADNAIVVKNFVRQFLNDYSNEMDFWEIMNVKLIQAILTKFPEMTWVKSVIKLGPDRVYSVPRESTVIYSVDKEALQESFSFTKLAYLICNETFEKLDLHVYFNIHDYPDQFDYPDYQWLDAAMVEFFKAHPMSLSKWKDLKPQLEAVLLEKFPTLTSITVEVVKAK